MNTPILKPRLRSDHLTQKMIDGAGFSGRFLNIKLRSKPSYRTHDIHLTEKDLVFEKINLVLAKQIEAVKESETGFELGPLLSDIRYWRCSNSQPKPKPTRFRRALHHLQLVEIV